ncbi:hypothetical protein HYX19_03455 [Candidatus Woesearchaeota archaeon]|nr:hypothetical protein [Candidatus Woesearchaeota archaeon]
MVYDVSSYKNCNLAGKRRARIYLIGGLVTGALLGYYLKYSEPRVNFYGDINSLSTVTVEHSFAPKTIDFFVTTKSGDKIQIVINGEKQKKQPEKEKLEKKVENKSLHGNSLLIYLNPLMETKRRLDWD